MGGIPKYIMQYLDTAWDNRYILSHFLETLTSGAIIRTKIKKLGRLQIF